VSRPERPWASQAARRWPAAEHGFLGGGELRGVDLVGPPDRVAQAVGCLPAPPGLERASEQAGARRRLGIEDPGVEVLALEHAAQRRWLERGRVVIEPPAHLRIGAEPEIDAGVIVGVERDAFERVTVLVDHADRGDADLLVDDVPIERREQRRRRGAVKARVVKEDL
jgi:hypothetical protein